MKRPMINHILEVIDVCGERLLKGTVKHLIEYIEYLEIVLSNNGIEVKE